MADDGDRGLMDADASRVTAQDEHVHPFDEWRGASGIFILVELRGPVADRIRALQVRYDPRLAAFAPPHLTLIGSSGSGPIDAGTPLARLRDALEPIARDTSPLTLRFPPPVRFMQTSTVVLPVDPHGPIRVLHDRIRRCGLTFARSRHAFTPHVTLNLYRTLTKAQERELLATRIPEPMDVDHLLVSLTEEPRPPKALFELTLTGDA
jgi:2'-5' RNA ligase